MSAVGLHDPLPTEQGRPVRTPRGAPRLVRLYLTSRRVPTALAMLTVCACVLHVAARQQWGSHHAPVAQLLPLVIETGAAAIIGVTTGSPIGEAERTGGRRLPHLRLGVIAVLVALAVGALCLGAAGTLLPGGDLDVARNTAGFAGVALLLAGAIGSELSWVGPLAYLVLADCAVAENWSSPWAWPGRPPHDLGGALCAVAVLAAGLIVCTVRGARDTDRDE